MTVRLGILCSVFILTLHACEPAYAAYTPYVKKIARITFAGSTPNVDNELKGAWINSCSRSAAGNITCIVKTGIFPTGSMPLCFCNAEQVGVVYNAIPSSATSVQIRMGDVVSTLLNVLGGMVGADTKFVMSCQYAETL